MKYSLRFILLITLATAVGCLGGDKPKYANVKGTVNFNGKPVEKGQIIFALEGRPPSIMDIVDGKFNGQAMVGSNKVTVSAKKRIGTAPKLPKEAEIQMKGYAEKMKREVGQPPVDYDPSMVEYIPAEWNTRSTQMRVVEAGAANEFEFNIRGAD